MTIIMKTAKTTDRRGFILSLIFFICCLCALASISEVQFDTLLRLRNCAAAIKNDDKSPPPLSFVTKDTTSSLTPQNSSENDIRILIGILTLPDQYNKRHCLRLIYGTQCQVRLLQPHNKDEKVQKVLNALEIMRYDDIIILNCKENKNKGKTYTYFSSLPETLNDTNTPNPPFHNVMKADDDTYFRLESLVQSLKPLPREDLYYGYVMPCPNPFVRYISGMGYLLSWNLVEWIRDSKIPRNNMEVPEDNIFGDWFRDGHKAKNRFNAKWSMCNFPEPKTRCTHELWPDTTAVHLLKNQEKWIKTSQYFNVTQNIKPSKLYHIP